MAAVEAGKRFGRLTALVGLERLPNRQRMWLCQCECGELPIIRSGNLTSGNTKSCGCSQRETAADIRRAIGQANRAERGMEEWTAKQLRTARIDHNGAREAWDRMDIFRRDGGFCQECLLELSPFGEFNIDHIIPLACGGPDAPWNLQLLCVPCNTDKYDRVYGERPCYCTVCPESPIGHPCDDVEVVIDCFLP